MGTIQINKVLFTSAIAGMRTATGNLDVTNKTWESMGEQSETFGLFVEGFYQLQAVMKQYQKLAYKDINAINRIGNELISLDAQLMKPWK
jgi:hypothetical protein